MLKSCKQVVKRVCKSDSEEDGCLHSRSTPGLRCGGLQTANQGETDAIKGQEGYASLGQWVLMPKNHMLVCIGNQDDPTIVEEVFLQDIDDLTSVYENVIAWQTERRSKMDSMYKARSKELRARVAKENDIRAKRRRQYFQEAHNLLETNLEEVFDDSDQSPRSVAPEALGIDQTMSPSQRVPILSRDDRNDRLLASFPNKKGMKPTMSPPPSPRGPHKLRSAMPSSSRERSQTPLDRNHKSYFSQLIQTIFPEPVYEMDVRSGDDNEDGEYVMVKSRTLLAAAVLALSGGIALIAVQALRNSKRK